MSSTVQLVNERTEPITSGTISTLATVTGRSSAVSLGIARSHFSLQVHYTSNPTAVQVDLEGSLDGAHWSVLGSWSLAGGQANNDIVGITGAPVTMIRTNLVTLTGGTTPTVTATVAGDNASVTTVTNLTLSPTNLATSARQDTGNTSLADIDAQTSPLANAVAVDLSTTDATLGQPSKGLYVGGAGDVKVDLATTGTGVIFKAVPVGTLLHVAATKVYKVGTTATNLLTLY